MVGVVDLGVDYLTEMEIVGRGGFAVVYSATDVRLDRRVAIKVLAQAITGRDQERFERECRVMGRLSSHPNVVTLHDAGSTPDGNPYLIMELVDGGTLADRLETGGPMPWREAIRSILPICDALGHAHDAGILHRDVKPENILVAGCEPRLTDFGIAQLRDSADGTSTGVSASWLHAAPETFDDARDARSDLYSLASTLFALIAGHAPFWRDGEDSMAPLMLRLANDPPPDLPPEAGPGGLNLLLQRALAKDPAERPQTAAELGAELAGLLTQGDAGLQTVVAPPAPATRPAARPSGVVDLAASTLDGLPPTKRRRSALAGWFAVGAFVAFVAGLVAMAVSATSLPEDDADDQPDTEQSVPDLDDEVPPGAGDIDGGDSAEPGPAETERIDIAPSAATEHTGQINAIAVLPDGRLATAGDDGNVLVWAADYVNLPGGGGAPLPLAGFAFSDQAVRSLVALPDGRLVAAARDDSRVLIWNPDAAEDGALVFDRHATPITAIAALPSGQVASSSTVGVLVWDPEDLAAEPYEFLGHIGGAASLLGLADGRIASGGSLGDGRVLVWDPSGSDTPVVEFAGHTDLTLTQPAEAVVLDLVELRDGRILSGSPGGLLIWSPDDLDTAPAAYNGPEVFSVGAVAVLADGRPILGGSGSFEVVDPENFQVVVGLGGTSLGDARATAMVALPDLRVVVGRADGSLITLEPYAD